MAFVNELVSPEDKAKYDWAKMPKPGPVPEVGMSPPSFWTIDRERNIFFICTWHGREEDSDQYRFLFWWNCTPMALHMRQEIRKPKTIIWHLVGCSSEFKNGYANTTAALREALCVYGFSGAPDVESLLGESDVQFSF